EAGAPGGFTYDLTGRAPAVSFIGVNPTQPQDMVFDFGSLHRITSADKEAYIYGDLEQEIDAGPLKSIQVGAKFTDHDRITTFLATTYGNFFCTLAPATCAGGSTPVTPFVGGPLPSNFLANIAAPGTLRQYYSIDRNQLQSIFFGLPEAARARILLPGQNFTVNEKAYGGYVMGNLEGEGWKGNLGVRIVRTDQTSTGQVQGIPASTPGAVTNNAFGVYLPVSVSRSYTDILPSLNLAFDLNDDFKLRVAAARTMTRPDYTDVVPAVSLNPGSRTGSGGNPLVDPYRANQFDVSFEYAPNSNTFGAVAIFYKDILSYIVNRPQSGIYPIELAPAQSGGCTLVGAGGAVGVNLYNCPFTLDVRSNGGGGRNFGFEFQVQHTLSNGFGAQFNYTYSNAKSSAGDPIPGNSKHSLNVTGFYENDWLSARLSYNYRSSFFINLDRASPLNQKGGGSLDASLGFNVLKNVTLTAEAVNLTNEKIEQFAGTPTLPRAIYDNGRQFYLGARIKF
ncbi:MAG: TonB-dependent receptor, partial [Sphingorhabdus sp.]